MDMFYRHMTEMVLSMVVPFGIFYAAMRLALQPAGPSRPFFFLFPVALVVMFVPMTAWMVFRHHPARDIAEMNGSMVAGMAVLLPIARFGFPWLFSVSGFGLMFPLMLVAMTVPMILLMFARREHYTHHGHHADGGQAI
jgi:hypothetical protein